MQSGLGVYRLILAVTAPLVMGYTASRAIRDGGWRYLRERNGLYIGDGPRAPIWLHCASVGEVSAAAPLLQRWESLGRSLLVTTATPTGAAQLKRRFPTISHAYLPMDYPGAVRRFLKKYRPRCALIVETEIWPHLYRACADTGIPLLIINGRLSPKTLAAPRWLRRAYQHALAGVTAILARADEDAVRFVELGADPARVEILGNLKFAAASQPMNPGESPLSRPYLLAASTREGEERLLAECWQKMRPDKSALLVIAPRHPERRDTIVRELAGWQLALRSRGDAVTDATQIYLVDTLGELPRFMAAARLVFMGGSLVPKGGHNLLEPAGLGVPIVVGPHMDNFQAEFELLANAGAIEQVCDVSVLDKVLCRLWQDESARQRMSEAARAVLAEQSGVLDAYEQRLNELIGLDGGSM